MSALWLKLLLKLWENSIIRVNMIKADKKVSTSVALSPLALTIMDYERGQESRSSYIDRMILKRAKASGV